MARSVWKGPFVDGFLLKKAEKVRASGRNEVIKIWSRRSTILPQFVGLTFGVYNGQKHVPVLVSEDMIGHKFGEFSPTLEAQGEKHYLKGGTPGFFPSLKEFSKEYNPHPIPLDLWDPFGFTKGLTPERKEKALLAEVNNGM